MQSYNKKEHAEQGKVHSVQFEEQKHQEVWWSQVQGLRK